MDYDRTRNAIILQGPDEIRPVLRAIGDLSAHGQHFDPEDSTEISIEDAHLASLRLEERSWSSRISVEEGSRMRGLADTLGSLIIRCRNPVLDSMPGTV